jgi:hypothetical protein
MSEQVEQGEAERRMHERGLHVHAQHDAEPDQRRIVADHRLEDLLRHRRQHRHDDEGDLEEVEEEGQEEDEQVDDDQETPDAARQVRHQVLDPAVAVDALEGDRKACRADQDEGHHRGDAHRRLEGLDDQVAQLLDLPGAPAQPDDRGEHDGEGERERRRFEVAGGRDQGADDRRRAATVERPLVEARERRIAHHGQHDGADGAHGAGLGRRRQAHHDRAEHQEDQHRRRNDAPGAFDQQRLAEQGARHRRHGFRPHDGEVEGVGGEQRDLQQRRSPGAEIHVADRAAELVGQDDQHQRRRHQLGDGARGRQHAGGVAHVVFVAQHHRQGDHRHGDDLGRHGAGDGAQDEADDDGRIAEPAPDRAEQLAHRFEHVLGQSALLQDGAHEGEERDGEQQFVGQDGAEHAARDGLHERHREVAHLDRHEAEEEADRGQRERHRIADDHEDHEAAEHEGRHPLERDDHCCGLS